jgi:hypothetical protein
MPPPGRWASCGRESSLPGRRVVGLRLEPATGVLEDDDLSALHPVDVRRQLADQDPVIDVERRLHGLRRHEEGLDEEGPDQDGQGKGERDQDDAFTHRRPRAT